MKKPPLAAIAILLICCQNLFGQSTAFLAKQYTQTADIILDVPIEKAFPLFGAIEEKKWAPGWNPVPVFPVSENIKAGYIFKTSGHQPDEDSLIWLVSQYDPSNYRVQYVVTGADRLVVIFIECHIFSANKTKAS